MGESLQTIIQNLLERIAVLEAENERLKQELAAAKKNSGNSSKPPSSDIVKPPQQGKQSKRKIGGQPGHKPNFRVPFTPERLDEAIIYNPSSLVCFCGGVLLSCPVSDQVQQQIEFRESPIIRREHRAPAYRCSSCGTFHREKLPRQVIREGFIGDSLAAILVFLNVKAHASYSALAAFLRDVCREPVSRGQIAKALRWVSKSLQPPHAEALNRLRQEPVINIDEAGHRELGKRFWTWVFRAGDFAVFHVDKTRASGVLTRILGHEYPGTIGCDYDSAYRKHLSENDGKAQFCLAHLIRELRFLRENTNPETRQYASRCLAALKRLFRIHHRLSGNLDADRQELVKAGESLWRAIFRSPPCRKAKNISKRFLDHGDDYLRFIATPENEPTNNRAEQAIRQVVIDRASSQGTRSQNGRAYKERMWTVLSTCAMRSNPPFTFIHDALKAHAQDITAPSLLGL